MAGGTRGAGGNGRATLHDVAQRAGVSPQTVSNYLNGRHVTRPATRERVDRAIRELGYRPNAAARALRSQRARSIAFLLEDPNNLGLHDPLHTEFLHGVAAAAHEADYHLTIGLTSPGETFPHALRLVREGRADGLVLSLGALANGAGFLPGPGEISAVIADLGVDNQTNIIEVVCPARIEVCGGATLDVCAAVTGAGPFSYMWFKDGNMLPGVNGNWR